MKHPPCENWNSDTSVSLKNQTYFVLEKSWSFVRKSLYFSHQSLSLSLLISTFLFLSVFQLISVFLCVILSTISVCLCFFPTPPSVLKLPLFLVLSVSFSFLFPPNLYLTLFLCCILSLLFWSQGYVFKLMAYMPISCDLLRFFLLINFLSVDCHCPGIFWLVWSCLCTHPEINI